MKKIITAILAVLLALLMSANALAFDGLKKGDRNNDVQALQLRLNELGYDLGTVDADYGSKTVAAVQAFQTDHDLPVTGEVDQATWDALYDEHITITRDGHSADVKLVPPFTTLRADEDSTQTAYLSLSEIDCALDLIYYTDVASLASDVQAYFKEVYDGSVSAMQAANYRCDAQSFTENGRIGATIVSSFDFVGNGGAKLTAYLLWSAVELAQDDSKLLMARANTTATMPYGYECLLTADIMRDMVSSVTLLDDTGADDILGDWYMLSGNDLIVLTFQADGTYTGDYAGSPIGGVWRVDGDGYLMDDANVMVVQGDRLMLSDDDVFQREPLTAPTLDTLGDADEADFEGDWLLTGVFMCDRNGLYDENDNFLDEDEGGHVSVHDELLTIDMFGESYDVIYNDGALYMIAAAGAEGAMFNGAEMRLLSQDKAIIYIPGIEYMCLTMHR